MEASKCVDRWQSCAPSSATGWGSSLVAVGLVACLLGAAWYSTRPTPIEAAAEPDSYQLSSGIAAEAPESASPTDGGSHLQRGIEGRRLLDDEI